MKYMGCVKVFPVSETKIYHLYSKKYVSKNIGGELYTYIDGHGYKDKYYLVEYLVIKNDSYIEDYKFFKCLRLAKQFAKQKHTEYINKLNELFKEKYGE